MEIIIRSRENGWETERRMELPEDDGLVKSILRSVKRRTNPPTNAGGVIENQVEEQPVAETPDTATGQTTAADPPAHVERTTFETGYRGFLILDCEGCGAEYIINARQPTEESVCRVCGHVTRLEELRPAEMRCPGCGKTWRYKTNSEEAEVTARCNQCGETMTARWNGRLRRYLPD